MADAPVQRVSPSDGGGDEIRERLLDAATRVFASKGYSGTKILDIVKEAGLSSGAVYGRFSSKDDLLFDAILRGVEETVWAPVRADLAIADLALLLTADPGAPLSDAEATQLEAFVAAKSEREVADAIVEARSRWRAGLEPLIRSAVAEGIIAEHADVESVLYFLEAVHLGLLMQRGAGMPGPDPEAWCRFIQSLLRVLAGVA